LHDCGLVCSTRAYLYKGQPCTGPAYAKCLRCAAATYGPLKGTLLTTGLRLSRPLHRHIDRYIAVSSAVREASLVGTGIPPREIEVVPTFIPDNVVDEARQVERPSFLPPPEEYILFVGKRNVHKGLDVLLAAHQGVSHLARLVALVTDEGTAESPLPPGVSVVRNASHAQVMAAWQDCAVGVVPSVLPEALPQVGIEAMACGKPVIASAIGGIPDLVLDGETGILVPAGDVDALREALRRVLTDPALRARLGAAGRQRARLFTVGVVADRIERIYHEVLEEEVQPCTAPIAL
jgi:glycosyltransferase involved in cell wall biosynthesis